MSERGLCLRVSDCEIRTRVRESSPFHGGVGWVGSKTLPSHSRVELCSVEVQLGCAIILNCVMCLPVLGRMPSAPAPMNSCTLIAVHTQLVPSSYRQ